ncbi:MAG: hypothetical protein SF187_29285 [Deltaproteobacteria bacterium]|nr:hypothetical protein [Deltaproteobacteria bacterium]
MATTIGRSFAGVSDADWQVTLNVPDKAERASWLAKDFSAPGFRKASQFDEAVLQVSSPQGPLHAALWFIHFPDCKALDATRDRVVKSQRLNLKTAALTLFRMHTQRQTLIFFLSETPMHPEVEVVLKSFDAQGASLSPCIP